MSANTGARTFSDRVVILFTTQVVASGIGVFNGFLLARLLGPAAKGDYYLLTLLPVTIMVLIQLGLPQAFGFFAARGKTTGIVTKTVSLTAILSLAAFLVLAAVLPLLRETFMHGLSPCLIVFALLGLPLALNYALTQGIVLGRQAVLWNAALNIGATCSATMFLVLLVGEMGLGVAGGVSAWLLYSLVQTAGFLIAARRVGMAIEKPEPASYRDLLHYALPLYPGSVTLFFDYRADVYLLAWLLASPAASLGYYSMAVSLAEMVFFLPNAVSALFFPHVAGSSREESDRQAPLVSRVTLLLTGAAALALAPIATVLIQVLLPAFMPALPALYILLPGVVALSIGKVVTGYVTGLGLTAISSLLNIGAFVLNVLVNLMLIPRFGILGASVASLVSYTALSVAFTLVAARLTHARVLDFWVPGRDDVRLTIATVYALGSRILRRKASDA
jgi:O-antigen/teichoic acid export membrane protein